MNYENKTKAELIKELRKVYQKLSVQGKVENKGRESYEKLNQSPTFYKNVMNHFGDPVFVKNEQHKWVYVNNAACKFWGYEREDLIGKSDYDIFSKDEAKVYWEKDNLVFHTEKVDLNEEDQTIDGKLHTISTKKSLYKDIRTGEKYIIGTIRDITKSKQAEEALRESEERFRQFSEATFEGIAIHEGGVLIEANKQFFKMFGYEPSEMIGRQIIPSLVPPESMERIMIRLSSADAKSYEELLIRKDGTRFPVEIKAKQGKYKGRMVRIVACRDVSVQRQAEKAVLESEQRFRELFNNISNGVMVYEAVDNGRDFIISDVNKAGEDIGKVKKEDIVEKSVVEVFPGVKEIGLIDVFKRVWKNGKSEYIPASLYKDERVDAWMENYVYKLPSGEIIAVYTDISKRKNAELKLIESEQLYRTFFEASVDGILIADTETKEFKYANPALCKMLGYSEEEFNAMGVEDIHQKESLEYVISEFVAQAKGEKTLAQDIPCLRKDGAIIYMDINTTSALIDGRKCNIGFFRDITEHRQLEEQLRQSQKMEAVGQLAGGVAHDFNNLLTAMLGYSEMLIADPGLNDSQRKYIEEIKKASERAASLTQQLLAFSRKQILKPKILNINILVTDIKKMLHRLIGEDIHLISKLDSKLGVIKADPGQVEQVIMNLVVNARDAMPKGGKLTIETQNVYLDEEYSKAHADVQPGWYVMLAVSDTGHGMDEETKEHIFEPFFTTKEKGKGTGLGLSTIYGIVKQSGGYVWVYSELNKGTSFKIYFPRIDEVEKEDEKKFKDKKSLKGSETILIVEDEEMVRDLIYESLKIFGYDLIEAENGKKALQVCKKDSEKPIHLLITDVIMPDMGGSELAKKLEKLEPDMKVLYMSGYTDNAIVHHGVLDEGVAFLQKPFSPKVLAQKVREILDTE